MGVPTTSVNAVYSLNVASTGGVNTTVTPTTRGAVFSFLHSSNASPSSCSLVLANSLNFANSGLLCRLFRGRRNVSLHPFRGSYNLVVCSLGKRSMGDNKSNYNYSTSILYSRIVGRVHHNTLGEILFITANTLVSTASDGRNVPVPSVTRTIILRI